MEIRITKARMSHLDECKVALQNSSLGDEYFPTEGSAISTLSEGISQGNIFVALDDAGDCLGFIYFVMKGAFHSYPFLHIIAVKEEYRGMGVGKKLIKFFEDAAFTDNPKVFLVVADFNADAQRLYERLGYRQVGEIPKLYQEGITEHLMMKDREDREI